MLKTTRFSHYWMAQFLSRFHKPLHWIQILINTQGNRISLRKVECGSTQIYDRLANNILWPNDLIKGNEKTSFVSKII